MSEFRASGLTQAAFCARGQPVPGGSNVARVSRPVGAVITGQETRATVKTGATKKRARAGEICGWAEGTVAHNAGARRMSAMSRWVGGRTGVYINQRKGLQTVVAPSAVGARPASLRWCRRAFTSAVSVVRVAMRSELWMIKFAPAAHQPASRAADIQE